MVLDNLVHQWLREGWLVLLVVTELSVTYQVDNDVCKELLTELGSKLERALHILHRVSIHVEDGRVDSLGDISRVKTGSSFVRRGSKTDLVIHADVDGAPDVVVGERLHLHLLKDDTLSSHSSVTVHDDWHDSRAITLRATERVLQGARSAHHYRVDSF